MAEKKSDSNIHSNHKERLRNRFLEECEFSNFYDHEILELLLSYCIIRGDTNETAHRLIDKFKTLAGVFEAHPEELKKVKGMGERSVAFIKMQYEIFRAFERSKYKLKHKATLSEEIIPYLKSLFFGRRQELLFIVLVDSEDRYLKTLFVSKGISDLQIDYREILTEALALNARGIILAHNHPNGILKPSEDDIAATKELERYLQRVNIRVIDHFIFVKDEYISILNSHSFRVRKTSKER